MWRSRPIFISSTFADMQAERDYLLTRVFPELEELLRARRHYLSWVDLRVGVATDAVADEAGREAEVLKQCLAEVKRCRPFLIVLLGDRYGWVPPADRLATAGFGADAAGRSVTDLEIEVGVLSDPEQQPRSFFYFREPLPYAQMPQEIAALYCEDYAPDAANTERKERLTALKRRIETRLPGRAVPYRVAWDGERQRATSLEDFGRMVLDDIWAELDAETGATAAQAEVPWQEAERNALHDFAEDRARDFTGREEVVARLSAFCLSPADDDAQWGLCVTGEPGSGKSALFGELLRRVSATDAFVLAHAAAADPDAASVFAMLRRWIDELAVALGVDSGLLAAIADPDPVEATFVRLLGQMAQRRRVAVLVDALDQFENTALGRYAAWVPRLWPENARLIATAIPGDASKALTERRGVEAFPLPPLQASDARGIAAGVCRRYGRVLAQEVVEALLTKTAPDGPAWSNPLWVVLAVEALNLLDADDFARAQRGYSGHPTVRLRDLMIDEIAALPSDIRGLYDYLFVRAEKIFGASLVRGFLGLIAVSRAGWREVDFQTLLPATSGESWDALKFAQLRRIFRGQLRQRGGWAQWDFNHAQMRAAVLERLAAMNVGQQNLHTIIADQLLSRRYDDPLHISDTMFHLLGSEDWARAARYYGDASLGSAERSGATRVLADSILMANGAAAEDAARRVCRLLATSGIDDSTRFVVANHFAFDLCNAIEYQAALNQRAIVADTVRQTFEEMLRSDPESASRARGLAVAYSRTGEVQVAQGDLAGAIESYRNGIVIAERLAHSDRDNVWWQNDLVASYQRLGDTLVTQGDLADALKAFRDGLATAEQLAHSGPANADWQRNLSATHDRIGGVLAKQGDLVGALKSHRYGLAIAEELARFDPTNVRWQSDLAASYQGVGYVQMWQGDLADALKSYRDSLAIAERLAGADPGDAQRQFVLSGLRERIGDVLARQGDGDGALTSYRDSLAIRAKLARSDPGNVRWRRNLSVAYNKVGDALTAQGKLADALTFYRDSLAIRAQLAQSDPRNGQAQHDLAASYSRLGSVQEQQGDLAGALKSYRDCLAINEPLVRADPTNAQWQGDLALSYKTIGNLQSAQGDIAGAHSSYLDYHVVCEGRARSNPGNADWQRDLAVSYLSLAYSYSMQQETTGAFLQLCKGRGIMAGLVAKEPSRDGWKRDLATFDEVIAHFK